MWDDARQLNAIAVTLTVIAVAFLAWAMVGWLTRLPAFDFREVVVTTPLVRASGAHLTSVIRGELTGTFFTMNLDDVFAADYAGELPQFNGPDAQAALMSARYREWSALLAPLALHLTGVALSARGGWQLHAQDDGGPLTLDIGRDDVAGRLERFLAVYRRT